ncbi:MAG TPA: VapC toxin family PIN domain ribonuclease [Deltaproteobacteria bacterium]|nr:VapC toxin family PIN domain ribonuclease [Deltaproteobacteria bacterium]
MILVDSSVWIDYFNGIQTSETDWLDSSLGNIPIIIGDLILTEVLQGFQNDRDFKIAKDLLLGIPFMAMGGRALALQSAMNYRVLRKKGVTVRKTIDVIIGTFCIHNQFTLLHCDRDFDPMVKYLGLEIFDI